jgi:hypothetical protein
MKKDIRIFYTLLFSQDQGVLVLWNEKIFEAIDKAELEELCNPLNHYKYEEKKLFFVVIILPKEFR